MPAVHIIGEIVGASGLRPRDACSVAHWLDVLSLHPSSRQSFFCRWRLGIRSFATTPPRNGHGETRCDEPQSPWRVLQGASRGQTQVHAYSEITSLHEPITKSSNKPGFPAQEEEMEAEDPPVELETLWCHPINLHLALAEMPPLPWSWPFLEFEVVSLDELHCARRVATASLPLPLAQHEFVLDLPLIRRTPTSMGDTMVELVDLHNERPDAHFTEEEEDDDDDEPLQCVSAGTLYVRLAVVQQGFLERGVFS